MGLRPKHRVPDQYVRALRPVYSPKRGRYSHTGGCGAKHGSRVESRREHAMSPLSRRQSTSTIVVVALVIAAAVALWIARANGFSARTPPTAVERVVMQGIHWLSVPRAARAAANPVAFSDEVWAESR